MKVAGSEHMHKRYYLISAYSIAHFLVDFACAFLMFRSITQAPDWQLCVLIYNFCAFAMQMPLGILADKWDRNFLVAITGCLLVGAAYGLAHISIAAVIVAGIGNALFHIGGGIDVLNVSEKKIAALGVFVSPGAFGIYFGTMLGKGDGLSSLLILLALVTAAGFIFIAYRAQGGTYPRNAVFSLGNAVSPQMIFAAACLFLVVCLRSHVGLMLDFPWKSAGYWGIALICTVVLGKAAGGFVADRFGIKMTFFFSLAMAALLFLFPEIPPLGIAAVLLFNMTMPLTLFIMAKIFPGAKGFSFGLLTFGLFLGFVPAYAGAPTPSAAWPFALAAVFSLALLALGLRNAKI